MKTQHSIKIHKISQNISNDKAIKIKALSCVKFSESVHFSMISPLSYTCDPLTTGRVNKRRSVVLRQCREFFTHFKHKVKFMRNRNQTMLFNSHKFGRSKSAVKAFQQYSRPISSQHGGQIDRLLTIITLLS